MEITYQDFINVCPSAETPSREIFDEIQGYFESRMFIAKGIVTDKIFRQLETVDEDVTAPEYDRLRRIRHHVKAYVCASAYYLTIPQLDLVLTPTGFGVVNNQNVAPASAERVSNLRKEIHRQECFHLDELIDLLRPIVDWKESTHGGYFFTSLFWRGSHMRVFGLPNPTRDDLIEHLPEIAGAAADMVLSLSPELYQALIHAEATDSASPMKQSLITMWRMATVAWCEHNGSWHKQRNMMLRFIEDNPAEFPEYFSSQTYKANHFQRYENKKDDSCFFFG